MTLGAKFDAGREAEAHSRTSHRVTFDPGNQQVWYLPGETLLDCARRGGVRVAAICGGRGLCKACVVRITEGLAAAPSAADSEFFSPQEIERNWRRACQTLACGDCRVEVPARAAAAPVRTQVETEDVWVRPDPAVRLCPVTVAPARLAQPSADDRRLIHALSETWPGAGSRIDIEVARTLPQAVRANGGGVSAAVRFGEVIGVVPTGKEPLLGLAVDLGTTNIAALLVDLRTGRTLGSQGIENPQTAYGGDVISRIGYARRSPGAPRQLRDLAADGINLLARMLCEQQSLDPSRIADVTVAGNTAMHHLFLGLPVDRLGVAPFAAAVSSGFDVKARDAGIMAMPGAYVHLLPNIAGFVGGDHTAVLLAIGVEQEHHSVIAIDIGTNTEMSLIHNGRLLSLSCPSGPALEGGHIRCGMRSAPGAIEAVKIDGIRVEVETIDGAPAVGICGSGVLDAVAQLYLAGVLTAGGRMLKDHPRIRLTNGQPAFVLANEQETGGAPVVFTQQDVRAVQLAKGAIRAGISILLEEAALEAGEIGQFVIAGAFGAYIDLESAIAIGMLPALPLERFAQVGNAASIGAKLALVSYPHRATAQSIAASSRYLELSSSSRFNNVFVRSIGFPERKQA